MGNKASLSGTISVPDVATSFHPTSRLPFDNFVHRPLFFVRMAQETDISGKNQSLVF
jgi:hypothetical protein